MILGKLFACRYEDSFFEACLRVISNPIRPARHDERKIPFTYSYLKRAVPSNVFTNFKALKLKLESSKKALKHFTSRQMKLNRYIKSNILLPKSQSHFVYDVVCLFEACIVAILVPNCFSVWTVIMFLIEKNMCYLCSKH